MYNSRYGSNLGKTIGMRFDTVGKSITEFFSDFEGFYKYGKKNKFNNSKINEDKKSGIESKKDSKIDSSDS